jgi:hypothetical protein
MGVLQNLSPEFLRFGVATFRRRRFSGSSSSSAVVSTSLSAEITHSTSTEEGVDSLEVARGEFFKQKFAPTEKNGT